MTNFTPEDLILFLYKESSPELTIAIEEALKSDWTLKEKLAVLKASHERLNTPIESPRTSTVLNILRYAEHKQSVKS